MTDRLAFLITTALATVLVALLVTAPTSQATEPTASPVVLELFTSEGCSSCPPADRLLAQLADSDLDVVTLAYHVTYWDYLGWQDRFADQAWDKRQEAYALTIADRRLYTPQVVVDGRWHTVGSDGQEVRDLFERAAAEPKPVRLHVSTTANDNALEIALLAKTAQPLDGNVLLSLAVTENKLSTPVGRGENRGRELRHERVVHELIEVGVLAAGERTAKLETTVSLDKAWNLDHVELVALAHRPMPQAPSIGAMVGATQVAVR
ncbi:MAG: DUF1223 domain-containing protein [Acidobacteriota bacterium]